METNEHKSQDPGCEITDQALLENRIPEMIEECEMELLHARYDMLLFFDGRILFGKFNGRIS